MSDSKIAYSRLERDPNSLLRLLFLVGVISILLILSLTGYGIYRDSREDVLLTAEDDAIRIATVMIEEHYNDLFSGGDDNIAMSRGEIERFNEHIRKFLHPFEIVKIKVFDLNRDIVFSTDDKIIGKKVLNNPHLERALAGEVDSHMETKGEMIDLVEEQRFDVDVVETYLPVRNSSGQIAGSFELYLDVSRFRDAVSKQVVSSVAILATILILVFAVAFIFVRAGVKQLRTVHLRLQKMAVTDPLTGIFNRGALISRAKRNSRGWSGAARSNLPSAWG